MSEPIDISGLDKADVLCALYDSARPLGLGSFSYIPGAMSREQATEHLRRSQYFDYLNGRVMKVHLGDLMLHVGLYDRDNGDGAAAEALRPLLEKRESMKQTG